MSLLAAVLSDTHIPSLVIGLPPRTLPREIFLYLKKADIILHAGDIVKATLLDELAAYAPVRAVRGNWDSDPSVVDLPETLEFEFGGVPVAMIHDSGPKQGRRNRLKRLFPGARAIIFGHSHIPGIEEEEDLLLLNPGSASSAPFTFALLHAEEGNVHGEIVDFTDGTHYSVGHFPPLSTERPKGADFNATTRKLLLEKADHRCQICSSRETLEIAHVVPVSEGGRGTLENGQVLCRRCRVEKASKDRRRKELNEHLEREPTRIISDRIIDWVFEHLSESGASLPVQKEELYGLTVERLITTLSEKGADYLALDLVRGFLSRTHDKYHGITRPAAVTSHPFTEISRPTQKVPSSSQDSLALFYKLDQMEEDKFASLLDDKGRPEWSVLATAQVAALVGSRLRLEKPEEWHKLEGRSVHLVYSFFLEARVMTLRNRLRYLRQWEKTHPPLEA